MTVFPTVSSLIADIDQVLALSDAAEASGQPMDLDNYYQVLQKTRSYLVSVESQSAFLTATEPKSTNLEQDTATKIAEAVIQQMVNRREQWLEPVTGDMESLYQQKQALVKEIKQLEGQKQELIHDFLQNLLNRCIQGLNEQIAATLAVWEQQLSANPPTDSLAVSGDGYPMSQRYLRLQNLQNLQQQALQIVNDLDVTLDTVFGTLERDLQAYQVSLTEGLEQIHRLGKQGEITLGEYLHSWSNKFGNHELLTANQASEAVNSSAIDSAPFPIEEQEELVEQAPEMSQEREFYPFAGSEFPKIGTIIQDLAEFEPEISEFEEIPEYQELEAIESVFDVNLEQPSDSELTNKQISGIEEILFQSDRFKVSSELEDLESGAEGRFVTPSEMLETLPPETNAVEFSGSSIDSVLFSEIATNYQPETELNLSYDANASLEDALFAESKTRAAVVPEETETTKPMATEQEITTIRLLTDLLEQGALNAQEEEELALNEEDHAPLDENLLPETVKADVMSDVAITEILAPEQEAQLDQDLKRFGGEDASIPSVEVEVLTDTSQIKNPWEGNS